MKAASRRQNVQILAAIAVTFFLFSLGYTAFRDAGITGAAVLNDTEISIPEINETAPETISPEEPVLEEPIINETTEIAIPEELPAEESIINEKIQESLLNETSVNEIPTTLTDYKSGYAIMDSNPPIISNQINYTADYLAWTFQAESNEDANCTLFGNWSGSWLANETKQVTANTALNFTPITFAKNGNSYLWNVNCTDTAGNTAWGTNYSFTVAAAAIPNSTNFSTGYGGTNFSAVPDITNVTNMTLATAYGAISFNETYGVNADGQNYDAYVNIGNSFVSVNTSALNPTFNASARITLQNVRCPAKIFYGDEVYNNAEQIIALGNECTPTTSPSCMLESCTGATLIFNVSHFTGYAGVGDTNLTIWDSNDTGLPYGDQQPAVDDMVKFYANYTAAENATCIINTTGQSDIMEWNETLLLYTYNRTFSSAGTFIWNVTCNHTGYEILTANDTVSIKSAGFAELNCAPPGTGSWTINNINVICINRTINDSVYLTNYGNATFFNCNLTYLTTSQNALLNCTYCNFTSANLNNNSSMFLSYSYGGYLSSAKSTTNIIFDNSRVISAIIHPGMQGTISNSNITRILLYYDSNNTIQLWGFNVGQITNAISKLNSRTINYTNIFMPSAAGYPAQVSIFNIGSSLLENNSFYINDSVLSSFNFVGDFTAELNNITTTGRSTAYPHYANLSAKNSSLQFWIINTYLDGQYTNVINFNKSDNTVFKQVYGQTFNLSFENVSMSDFGLNYVFAGSQSVYFINSTADYGYFGNSTAGQINSSIFNTLQFEDAAKFNVSDTFIIGGGSGAMVILNDQPNTNISIFGLNDSKRFNYTVSSTAGMLVMFNNTYANNDIAISTGSNAHTVINQSRIAEIFARDTSTVLIEDSYTSGGVFSGTSYTEFRNSAAAIYTTSGTPILNFSTPGKIEWYREFNGNPRIWGYFNITVPAVQYFLTTANVVRYYPVQVNYTSGLAAAYVHVNISNGTHTLYNGTTDSNGFIWANITFTNETRTYSYLNDYTMTAYLNPENSTNFTFFTNTSKALQFTLDVDTDAPIVNLTYPENNSGINYNTDIQLNYTVNDTSGLIKNCSLYWDSIYNQTNSSAVIEEAANSFYINSSDGTHTWLVSCIDDSLLYNVGNSTTFTLKIDSTDPIISDQINYTEDYLTWTFSANTSEDANCTLFGNWTGTWQANETINVSANIPFNFTPITFAQNGKTYLWNVNCTDAVGNNGWGTNYSFTVAALGYTEITNCTNITEPGVYHLTANITNSAVSQCIKINVSNVILDCMGNTIDGNGAASRGIYIFSQGGPITRNVSITHCTLTDWAEAAVYISSVYAVHLDMMNITSSTVGLLASGTEEDIFENSFIYDNQQYDINFLGTSTCNNIFTNLTGTDNKPIVYYNSAVNIENWNNNASEIILCNADNSRINNLTFFKEGIKNNLLHLLFSDYVNISNSNFSNTYFGIKLDYSNNANIRNIAIENAVSMGLDLETSPRARIEQSVFKSSNINLRFYQGDDNNITNCTSQNASNYGMSFSFSENNIIRNFTANQNQYGVYITSSNNNNIFDSAFINNTNGIYLANAINLTAYNNYLNNSNNFGFSGTLYNNTWNTTYSTSTNIIGKSAFGGNYWAYPNGTGYSQTCLDANDNWICDSPYTIATDNIDYLPLSDHTSAPNITNQINYTSDYLTWIFSAQSNENANCTLWGNWSGNWQANETVNVSADAAFNFTPITFTGDGNTYLWNLNCTDSVGNNAWGTNYSFTIASMYDLTDCFTITTPGVYTLQNNIINSTIDRCINIQTSNVTVNCAEKYLDGNNTAGASAIYFAGKTNITIKNCIISEWEYGIYIDSGSTNSYIDNCSFYNITQRAISLDSSSSILIENNEFRDNTGLGIAISSTNSVNNIIRYNQFYNASGNSIYITNAKNTSITYNDFTNSSSTEILTDQINKIEILYNRFITSHAALRTGGSNILISYNTMVNSGVSWASPVNYTFSYNNVSFGSYPVRDDGDLTGGLFFGNYLFNNSNPIRINQANNVTIANNTLVNNTGTGIYLISGIGNLIANNTIRDNPTATAIYFERINESIVNNNFAYNNYNGMTFDNSDRNNVTNNNWTLYNYWIMKIDGVSDYNLVKSNYLYNSSTFGLYIEGSNNIIEYNAMQYCTTGNNAIVTTESTGTDNIIRFNNISHSGQQVRIAGKRTKVYNNTIFNASYGIYILEENCSIYNNTIRNHQDYGILMQQNANNNNISYNLIENVGQGIKTDEGSNNHFEYNTIQSTSYAVYIRSSDNIISNNQIYDNTETGIYLIGDTINNTNISYNYIKNSNQNIKLNAGKSNIVYNNILTDGQYGIMLYSPFNQIYNNTINGTISTAGINLQSNAHNSSFQDNIITTTAGDYGIRLYSGSIDNNFTGNKITGYTTAIAFYDSVNGSWFYNNYINATNSVYIDQSSIQLWNTTYSTSTNILGKAAFGGNYWAYPNGTGYSQTCLDADDNWICDSPYTLATDNIDYLPLSDHTSAPNITNQVNYTPDYLTWIFQAQSNENANCTLFGNWSGSWLANETKQVLAGTAFNFTSITFVRDGKTYLWNVNCTDSAGNTGWGTNYTFTIAAANNLPNATNLTLTSNNPLNRTNATLFANWTFYDIDSGDTQQAYETLWYNNSIEITILRNATNVSSNYTKKNQNWSFSVRVSDGLNWSLWTNSSQIKINNALPTAPAISIYPAVPLGGDWMYCNITTNSTDLDNDSIQYLFTWYKNNAYFSDSGWTTALTFAVNPGQTKKTENWNCTVIANDGQDNSTAASVSKVIANNPPEINVSVSSTDSLNRTNGSLVGTISFYDKESDNATANQTKWYLNNTEIVALVNLTTVNSSNVSEGNWTFSARSYDGQEWSQWAYANITVIGACTDADLDGYFIGAGCTPADCNDADASQYSGAPCSLPGYTGSTYDATCTCTGGTPTGGGGGGSVTVPVVPVIIPPVIPPVEPPAIEPPVTEITPEGEEVGTLTPQQISEIVHGSQIRYAFRQNTSQILSPNDLIITFTNLGNKAYKNLKVAIEAPMQIEKPEVLHPHKIWGWDFVDVMGWVTSKQSNNQKLLEWGVAEPKYYDILRPGESIDIDMGLKTPLTTLGAVELTYKIFSYGTLIYEEKVPVMINASDFIAVADIDTEQRTVDLYLVISNFEENEKRYNIEFDIDKPKNPDYQPSSSIKGLFQSIFNGPTTIIAEQYGPYRIAANDSTLLAYQYKYSERFADDYKLRYSLWDNGVKIHEASGDLNLSKR